LRCSYRDRLAAGPKVRQTSLPDTPALVDDHSPIGELGHLGQQVAGDQDRRAAYGELAQQTA